MLLIFSKYQGAGNDFVLRNCFNSKVKLSQQQIAHICDRKFGVGADGYIEIHPSSDFNFEMRYYNADGNLGSMCGNGARCAVAFAKREGIIVNEIEFIAYDGKHKARIIDNNRIEISIKDVDHIFEGNNFYFMNTGSPHYIRFVSDLESFDVSNEGEKIRRSKDYSPDGTNVNFAELKGDQVYVRTYERGVENETLSCGTGVTAVALAVMLKMNDVNDSTVKVQTKGGELLVKAHKNSDNSFNSIFLEGPASFVFSGQIDLS